MTHFTHSSIETALISHRSGERLEMTLLHSDVIAGPTVLIVASYPTQDNPNLEPSQRVELSLEGARLLRALLNQPEVAAVLDQE